MCSYILELFIMYDLVCKDNVVMHLKFIFCICMIMFQVIDHLCVKAQLLELAL